MFWVFQKNGAIIKNFVCMKTSLHGGARAGGGARRERPEGPGGRREKGRLLYEGN